MSAQVVRADLVRAQMNVHPPRPPANEYAPNSSAHILSCRAGAQVNVRPNSPTSKCAGAHMNRLTHPKHTEHGIKVRVQL